MIPVMGLQPQIVKKVRYDESAKVAEDVKKVKIDEGEAVSGLAFPHMDCWWRR